MTPIDPKPVPPSAAPAAADRTGRVSVTRRVWVAAALGGLVSAWAWAQSNSSEPAAPAPAPPPPPAAAPKAFADFVKGGNVSAWNIADVDRVFADAERLGLDTITIPVRVSMAYATGADAAVDPASLAFAKRVAAHSPKYRYILEPYPWIAGGTVAETELAPTDKAAWFAAYEKAVLEIAGQFPSAWGIYVASNLVKLEDQTASWLNLIAKVRSAFAGKVIYRTQWWVTAEWEPSTLTAWKAKLNNAVFGAVDIIGIAAYFELSEAPSPSADELKAALRSTGVFGRKQNVLAEITALQRRWQKPIFLGELSCPAVDLGAQTPWDPAASEQPNREIQKNYFSAYLESLAGPASAFLGFSVFTIAHPTPTTYDLAAPAAEFVRHYRPRQP